MAQLWLRIATSLGSCCRKHLQSMYTLEQWFAFIVVHQPASGSRCAAESKRAVVVVATSLVQWGSHMDILVVPLGQ